jgi:hypothetical protein
MRAYADEIDARASAQEAPAARAARVWAEWIREHAERTDPLNGPLSLRPSGCRTRLGARVPRKAGCPSPAGALIFAV